MKKSPELKYAEKWYHYYKFISISSFIVDILGCVPLSIFLLFNKDFAINGGIFLLIFIFIIFTLAGVLGHIKSKNIWNNILEKNIKERNLEKKREE